MGNQFQFGMGAGHLPEKAAKIARKYGAELVNYTEPGNGQKRHWFTAQNMGQPHNSDCAKAVLGAIGSMLPTVTYSAQYRAKDKFVHTRKYATAEVAQHRLMGTIGLFPLLGEVAGDAFDESGRCTAAPRLGGLVSVTAWHAKEAK